MTRRKFLDVTGRVFGRLYVMNPIIEEKFPIKFLCKCECGKTISTTSSRLLNGNTRSCGCYRTELFLKKITTHGKYGTKVYETWHGMKTRCLNSKDPSFKWYGARGIKICDRWMRFENFYQDMGEPSKGMTLDRIDNNGNYGPGNCRWVSFEENNNNKRNNVLIEFNGEKKTISQWSRKMKIKRNILTYRLMAGWSIDDCFHKKTRSYSWK